MARAIDSNCLQGRVLRQGVHDGPRQTRFGIWLSGRVRFRWSAYTHRLSITYQLTLHDDKLAIPERRHDGSRFCKGDFVALLMQEMLSIRFSETVGFLNLDLGAPPGLVFGSINRLTCRS